MALNLISRLRHAWIVLREGIPIVGDDIDSDSHLYRRLSQRETKDIAPYTRDRMLKMVYYLWVQNPMARSIVEMKKDYVVGDGLTYEAEDEDVQQVLNDHWNDPINKWDRRIHRAVRELSMWGEQIWPVFVQEHTGRVRFGYIDPAQVKDVIVDPMNVELAIGVIIRSSAGKKEYKLKTVLPNFDEGDLSEEAAKIRESMTAGQCFYFSINKLSNSTRGLSDLIQVVDMIDMYDECQFTRGEKVKIAGNYFFKCTMKGANENELKATQKKEEGKIPKPGTVKYQNENIEWDVVAPNMKAQDYSEDMRRMKNYILAGVRFPEHFFGEGGEVNYATALSMHAPVNKAMRSSQGEVESIMADVFAFVIAEAKKAGVLSSVASEEYKSFGFPEIDTKDLKNLSAALQQTVTALSTARLDNAITDDEYRSTLKQLLTPFGVELSDEDIAEQLDDDAVKKGFEPYAVTAAEVG